jgi:mannose-6-phosphate isomerase-like protein (cupin superfamily)
MLEKLYSFTIGDEKNIERIIDDENININHMVLTKDTGLPVHYSNSNVYLIIVRGRMTIKLGEQEPAKYDVGSIINVPFKIKMNINNFDEEVLEFFVVKAPHPRDIAKKVKQ